MKKVLFLVGHGSGIPSSGLRKACLFVCHKNCLLWTIPSIPSISFFHFVRRVLCSESERFCFVFPLFVHNPSAFRREVPSKLPRSPPKPRNVPRSPFTLRRRSCPVAQAPFSCSPPAVSARLRSKRCLDELGLHGPCGLPPLSGWQGGGRTRLIR